MPINVSFFVAARAPWHPASRTSALALCGPPAQASPSPSPQVTSHGIEDAWPGMQHVSRHDRRILMKISRGDKGELKIVNSGIDQGGAPANFEEKGLEQPSEN